MFRFKDGWLCCHGLSEMFHLAGGRKRTHTVHSNLLHWGSRLKYLQTDMEIYCAGQQLPKHHSQEQWLPGSKLSHRNRKPSWPGHEQLIFSSCRSNKAVNCHALSHLLSTQKNKLWSFNLTWMSGTAHRIQDGFMVWVGAGETHWAHHHQYQWSPHLMAIVPLTALFALLLLAPQCSTTTAPFTCLFWFYGRPHCGLSSWTIGKYHFFFVS